MSSAKSGSMGLKAEGVNHPDGMTPGIKAPKKWYDRGAGVVEESMGWPPPKGSESYSYPQGYFGLRHDVAEVPVRVMKSGSSLGKALDKQEEDLPFKKLQRR